ncbi:MAG: type II toxin-antitoxin system RelE/ParE family toxin [Anaerolineaceae bacterium]|nr:type II toxin-antitoxin system RelE/ParE family toxin [Anaerolineaceae bacterium]
MKIYTIIITPDAESDLWEIRDYIANTFLTPDTALDYIHTIREEIAKLEYLAASIAPVPDEPWHSRKIRRILAKNYYVYYRIIETENIVSVLNVIYQKRDQIQVLQRYTI